MANSPQAKFASSFINGVAGLAVSIGQAQAAREQGRFAESQARIRARFAEMQARDILEQGDKDAQTHGKRIRAQVGSQRAALAAQGIVVDEGTASEIQSQTVEIGFEERQSIRNNAWRRAFGIKTEAQLGVAAGQLERSQSDFVAANTLITGGLNFINSSAQAAQHLESGSGKKNTTVDIFDPTDYGSES